ncbi:hypothetical protein GCM10009804_64160 [Kribbella hippodromi]|uniref:Uncharacterized protein n=1 Tax=Kribbella hippodromi TaxID=434347 RepID=A0ABN2E7D4_9ACTN
MPRNTVPPVPVVTQPSRPKRFPQLLRVIRTEAIPSLTQNPQRQRIILPVKTQQPRHINHPVIHLPPLRVPRHFPSQPLKNLISPLKPPRQHINPSPPPEHSAPHPTQRPHRRLPKRVQQRPLNLTTHPPTIPETRTPVPLINFLRSTH